MTKELKLEENLAASEARAKRLEASLEAEVLAEADKAVKNINDKVAASMSEFGGDQDKIDQVNDLAAASKDDIQEVVAAELTPEATEVAGDAGTESTLVDNFDVREALHARMTADLDNKKRFRLPRRQKKTIDAVAAENVPSETAVASNESATETVDAATPGETGPVASAEVPPVTIGTEAPPAEAHEERLEADEPATPESKEMPTDLDAARIQYITALRARNAIFSKDKKFGTGKRKEASEAEFQAIKTNYEQLKKAAFLKSLRENGVDLAEQKETDINKYLELLAQEDKSIDALATASERSSLQKFQEWWKRNWKLRLAAGSALFATGAAMTATGVGAGAGAALFGIARGVMSGTGAYMTAEAQLDRRTGFLGQKGLIDKAVGLDFALKGRRAKEIEKAIKAKAFERYSIDELRQEIARLRVQSLDKGVTLENAGRFGVDQAPVVKLLLDTYYQKIRAELSPVPVVEATGEEVVGKGKTTETVVEENGEVIAKNLEQYLDDNIDASGQDIVSAVDKNVKKKAIRHLVSGLIGVGTGVTIGNLSFHKVADDHSSSYEDIKKLFPKDKAAADWSSGDPELKAFMSAQTEATVGQANNINEIRAIAEVNAGDTVWSLAKEQLHQRLGNDFDSLDEARKTYLIDAIKDKIAANPAAFGLKNIDQLRVGQQIDFTQIFKDPSFLKEIQTHAEQLDQADLDSIIHNNDVLKEAAKHGVKITSANVDDILANVKAHGLEAINADGSLKEVATASTAAVQAGVENIDNNAVKSAAEIAKETVDNFVKTDGAIYTKDVFAAAKSTGSLDQLCTKVLAGNNIENVKNFVSDWAHNEGLSDNKREIFLGSLQNHDRLDLGLGGQLNADVHGLDILKANLKAFDATLVDANTHTVAESVKAFENLPKDEWSAVKVGDQYALVRKVVDHKLIFHKLRWLVSFNANQQAEMTIGDKDSLTRILANKSFGGRVIAGINKVVSANIDRHPPVMQ